MNPMILLQLKQRLDAFRATHPIFQNFLSFIHKNAIEEGSIIEIKVITPDGKEYESNLKLTAEDVETIRMIEDFRGQM